MKKANQHKNKHSGQLPKHPKKHHKPFRYRHVGLLVIAVALISVSLFQFGSYVGRSRVSAPSLGDSSNQTPKKLETLKSEVGFSLNYDSTAFYVASSAGGVTQQEDELMAKTVDFVAVLPKPGALSGRDSATKLTLATQPEYTNQSLTVAGTKEIANKVSDEDFQVVLEAAAETTLNGASAIKREWSYTPKFGSATSKVYATQWLVPVNGRLVEVNFEGMVGDNNIPTAFAEVIDSIEFSSIANGEVLGATSNFGFISTQSSDTGQDYTIDSVSPAVVKVYHAVCGSLVVFEVTLQENACNFITGSGFFISSNGYVATNGHVVTYGAKEAFTDILQSSPETLNAFLKQAIGMTDKQVEGIKSSPTLLAAVLAEIYDIPDTHIKLQDEQHTYFVALGTEPIKVQNAKEIFELHKKPSSEQLARAKLIDVDYSTKDIYVIGSGDSETGFSASDVALLKIAKDDTPFLRLYDGVVTQNMGVSILGFPGDAENILIDTTVLGTTVTNGSISAIRNSAGGNYQLYQSDADASSGSSGGPAITPDGEALGLLTYRFKNEVSQDAAKSYIRAVADLEQLVERNDVTLAYDGEVQASWDAGLEYFSQNKYSRAVEEFGKVKGAYSAHRLVDTYIARSNEAIAEGRDVQDAPLIQAGGIIIGGIGTVAAVVIILRHRAHHERYKQLHIPPASVSQ